MTKEITAEQRSERAKKGAATAAARREAERERWRQERRDGERALEVCRQIRDSETANDRDRLKAVELLLTIKKD